jgi:hypothetical protein
LKKPHEPLPAVNEDAIARLEALRSIATADDGGKT